MVGLWQEHSAHSIKGLSWVQVLSKGQRSGGVSGIQSQKILLESSGETLLQSFPLLQRLKNWPRAQLFTVLLSEKNDGHDRKT